MVFSFEGGDAKRSVVERRAQRPRRDVDLDQFSQVLRGSASDFDSRDRLLIAETNCDPL